MQELRERLELINWEKYNGPKNYKWEEVPNSLLSLLELSEEKDNEPFYHWFLFVIGNNHRGTYYPVIIEVLPIIMEILFVNNKEVVRNCILEILTDLYMSFGPELGEYKELDGATILKWVADEVIVNQDNFKRLLENQEESKRNKELLKGIVKEIQEGN